MREILFRGKRKDNGEWVYGDLVHSQYKIGDTCVGQYGNTVGIHQVDPETVGQYTWMNDKNGTMIFEGDIVESQYTQKPYLVCFGEYTYTEEYEYEQEACGWYNQDINGCITGFGCPERWATVIGNIHDNPELIGGQEDGE